MFSTLVLILAAAAATDDASTGPAIREFGPVVPVPAGSFGLDPKRRYPVVFDVAAASSAPGELNRSLETVARFLNLHARQGLDPEHFDVTVVIHGGATVAALSDVAHRKRQGVANPNLALLERLAGAGAEIFLCGQSAGFRGIEAAELAAPVAMAVSAMTVLVARQSAGYSLIAF